ncbi:MAG: hypothetical protein ACRYF3_06105 [Janthinobacterium lividum]
MSVDLGKGRDGGNGRGGEDGDRGAPDTGPVRAQRPPIAPSQRALRRLPVDETRLSARGALLPGGVFLSDRAFRAVRFLGLGLWIFTYTQKWELGFVLMWVWIAANTAYQRGARARRRQRKCERRALRLEAAGGPAADLPPGRQDHAAATTRQQSARRSGVRGEQPVEVARITGAERTLIAIVRRVDTSARFDRVDLVLVHEIADLLGPLLVRVAAAGADARVRHDVETLATEHLPRTVDDFLTLPVDYVGTHHTCAGTTPAQELRSQLHLLLEGCERLREAVHEADVTRQQEQSRFLDAKFRRSDLDL